MTSTKKYLPVLAAFIVGVTGAAGYAVHAQSVGQASTTSTIPAVTGQAAPDGETADDGAAQIQADAKDQSGADLETNDDGGTSLDATSESESGPGDTGSDVGETD